MIIGIDGRAANTPKPLGAAVYCRELIGALAGLCGPPALRVYLDAPPLNDFPACADAVDIRVLPRARLWTERRLGPELRRDPPDVFLGPVQRFPLRCPCPAVVTHHGLVYVERAGSGDLEAAECLSIPQRINRAITLWLIARFADHVLVVSKDSKQLLARFSHIPPERISVTYHACSHNFYPRSGTQEIATLRGKFDLPERYILYTGRLGPRKNVVRTIEAFAMLRERRPDLPHRLVLAGEREWSAQPIIEAAERSPAREFIQFLGHVDREDMPVLMSCADTLVLVSLCESFGIPLIEAMSCGTPVVTANSSAMPEIVGDAALLADPYDVPAIAAALERVLTDQALRADLKAKGLERARRFSWVNTASDTLQVLSNVVEAQPRK